LSETTKLGTATTQREAKRFFVDKIVAQAVAEGEPLSNSELRMLNFSEPDPESAVEVVSADEPDGEGTWACEASRRA